MSEYILSNENFDAGNEIQFRNAQRIPYILRYQQFYTDGEMVLDTNKNYYSADRVKDLTENQFNTVIKPFIQK